MWSSMNASEVSIGIADKAAQGSSSALWPIQVPQPSVRIRTTEAIVLSEGGHRHHTRHQNCNNELLHSLLLKLFGSSAPYGYSYLAPVTTSCRISYLTATLS